MRPLGTGEIEGAARGWVRLRRAASRHIIYMEGASRNWNGNWELRGI